MKLIAKLKRLKIVLKNWNKNVLFGRVEQQLQQLEGSIVELELEKILQQAEILIKQEAGERWLKKRKVRS